MDKQDELAAKMREDLIHRLRMQGWSRIDAENEADDREERRRAALSAAIGEDIGGGRG